jgi:RNA polymerase sigma factor (sigma-70 family)
MSPALLRMAGDERLARLVTAGHDHAFAALYDRYRDVLVRYCRSVVRDDQDALDAFQSTMLNALRALREDRRRAPVRPWLFRIAHNESVSVLRRRPAAEPLDDRQVASVDVHRTAEDREALAGLLEDLAALTDHQRSALLLRELGGLDYDDVASVLETTPLAARQAVFAARASLYDQREGRELPCAMVQRRLSDTDRRAARTRAVRAHLRRCDDCRGFASSIQRRRRAAILVPVPPAFASSGVLASIIDAGGGGAGAGGGAVAAGVVAKAAVALSAAAVATGAAQRPAQPQSSTATAAASGAVASVAAGHATRPPATGGAVSAARTAAGSGVVQLASVIAPAATTDASATPPVSRRAPRDQAGRVTGDQPPIRADGGWGRRDGGGGDRPGAGPGFARAGGRGAIRRDGATVRALLRSRPRDGAGRWAQRAGAQGAAAPTPPAPADQPASPATTATTTPSPDPAATSTTTAAVAPPASAPAATAAPTPIAPTGDR